MKLNDIFKEFVNIGIERDPRGKKFVKDLLSEIKEKYASLSAKERKYYDKEKLENPYLDSRIYNDVDSKDISSVMVGIDIETPELVLLDHLRSNGQKIDAAITHHPEGRGLSNLDDVMSLQIDVWNNFGIPINIAENLMNARITDVANSLMPVNYNRAVDAARLLKIAFLGVHTPSDNCVATYLQAKFDKEKPKKLKDIIDILLDIEEYQISYKDNNSPKIIVGTGESRCGKIFVDMTGGTEGPVGAIEKLADAGVGTIVGMHLSQKHITKAKECNINVLVAGHIASDNLGLNLLLDEFEKRKKRKLNVISCSGFRRIIRNP